MNRLIKAALCGIAVLTLCGCAAPMTKTMPLKIDSGAVYGEIRIEESYDLQKNALPMDGYFGMDADGDLIGSLSQEDGTTAIFSVDAQEGVSQQLFQVEQGTISYFEMIHDGNDAIYQTDIELPDGRVRSDIYTWNSDDGAPRKIASYFDSKTLWAQHFSLVGERVGYLVTRDKSLHIIDLNAAEEKVYQVYDEFTSSFNQSFFSEKLLNAVKLLEFSMPDDTHVAACFELAGHQYYVEASLNGDRLGEVVLSEMPDAQKIAIGKRIYYTTNAGELLSLDPHRHEAVLLGEKIVDFAVSGDGNVLAYVVETANTELVRVIRLGQDHPTMVCSARGIEKLLLDYTGEQLLISSEDQGKTEQLFFHLIYEETK